MALLVNSYASTKLQILMTKSLSRQTLFKLLMMPEFFFCEGDLTATLSGSITHLKMIKADKFSLSHIYIKTNILSSNFVTLTTGVSNQSHIRFYIC